QAASDAQAQSLVSAVNGLPAQGTATTITANLGSGTYSGTTASPPAGTTPVLVGDSTTTIAGPSPALPVTAGTATPRTVTPTNASDAARLLVSGGHLVLRNVVLQESTAASQAAVLITGGTVDLGTQDSPGGNVFNVNGQGALIRNAGAGAVSALGNTF